MRNRDVTWHESNDTVTESGYCEGDDRRGN